MEEQLKADNIQGEYKKGLQALGSNRKYIKSEETQLLCGSIDIDLGYKSLEPNASRWDYIVCWKGQVFFVEIHPATSGGDVKEVLNKLNWLKNKLKIWKSIQSISTKDYYYIHTGDCRISDKKRLQLTKEGIKVKGLLKLS